MVAYRSLMNTTTNETGGKWEAVCWDVGHKTATETCAMYRRQSYEARVISTGPGFGWTCEVRKVVR